jgi:KDO2-lipid IV(A) lauroyltransferase
MLISFLTGLLKLISWLPLPAVHGLGRLIGFVFGRVVRHHRADAFEALERSMPELSPKQCRRMINTMYSQQGVNAVEMIWYSMRGLDVVRGAVEYEGLEHLDRALARGKGALAMTAHISNFELSLLTIAAKDYKTSVVVKTIKNKAVNEVVQKLRGHEGLSFLPAKNAYRDCLRILKRNEVVGMVIDQNMTRKEGIFVDFFGKPACTSPGLAYMAAQSKAPVVPMFIYRTPRGTLKFKVLPLIEPPPDRSPESMQEATQHYTRVVEDAIREAPEQWIWMHRRWRTVPPEAEAQAAHTP